MALHNATKYLGGHGEDWAAARRRVHAVTVALLHPLSAYLLHRGLTTLPTRMHAQQASARRNADGRPIGPLAPATGVPAAG